MYKRKFKNIYEVINLVNLLTKKIGKKNQKGFTLAELLIVVAIVGVLVAISVPVFTSKLEKARETTDVANMRAAKAVAGAQFLDDELADTDRIGTFYYNAASGLLEKTKSTAYGKGTTADGGIVYPDYESKDTGSDHTKEIIEVKIESDGKIKLNWVPAA